MPVTTRSLLVRRVNGVGKKSITSLRYDHSKQQVINTSCFCLPKPPIIIGVGIGPNTLLYSLDDGLTWTGLGNTIFEGGGTCAVWNGTIWASGGTGFINAVAYSYDGINWTGVGAISTGPSSNVTSCSSMVWTGTYFVGVYLDIVIRSLDGITWEGLSGVTAGQLINRIATNGSRIVGIPLVESASYLSISDDQGGSFYSLTIPEVPNDNSNAFFDILWDGTKFIVTIADRTDPLSNPSAPPLTFSKLYSPDGITWTPIPNVAYKSGNNIGFKSPSLYISRGIDPNSTERSTDGINWVSVSDPVLDAFVFNANGKGTIFSSQKYIFICGLITSNNYIYSPDGLTWTLSSTNVDGKFNSGFSTKPLPS